MEGFCIIMLLVSIKNTVFNDACVTMFAFINIALISGITVYYLLPTYTSCSSYPVLHICGVIRTDTPGACVPMATASVSGPRPAPVLADMVTKYLTRPRSNPSIVTNCGASWFSRDTGTVLLVNSCPDRLITTRTS